MTYTGIRTLQVRLPGHPLFPAQRQSTELPVTTVGGCRRRLDVKTQGRTLDCPFTFPPPRNVVGWFFHLCRREPLA